MMDAFTSAVKPQIVYLDGLDAACSIVPVPMCYWYSNNNRNSWDVFMPPMILEQAFYKTLQEFPIFAGHSKTDKDSRMYIEVDKNNMNMPVYTDTCCDMEFAEMIESRFDIRKLPIDLSDECGVPATYKSFGNLIKLAFFRVIRFNNNSGVLVFASVSHCLVDGHGFTLFMSRWAEIAKWMQKPQDVYQAPFPKRQYTHDRAVHSTYRSNQTASLDTFTLESMSSGNMLTRWLAWISPETRGKIFKALSNAASRVCYYLHIPSEGLENLRTSVQKHAPPGMRYSINDIIVAYVTILVARAKEKASADWWSRPVPSAVRAAFGAKLGEHTGFLTTVAVNIRPRIDHTGTDNYTGNMSLGKYIWFPQDMVQVEPTDKALSALALKTHQAVSDVDKEYIGQFGHLLNKEPDSYMRLTLCNAKHRRKLVISTQVRFAHYKVDFGAGTPLLVRFAPYAFPDVVLVMPGNPEIGGYEITLNLAPEIAAHVIQDAGWMKIVDKYDCII